MSERDELRADLLDEHGYCVNCGEDTEDCECGFGEFIDATTAAGWRKPRVVTTAAELWNLPALSVISDCHGHVYQKFESDDNDAWLAGGDLDAWIAEDILVNFAPVTLIREGAPE